MTKAKNAIPQGFRSLTQYLVVDGATTFMQFIAGAFGATEKFVAREGAMVRHAEARVGDSIIEFADAGPQWKAMPAGLHFYVPDCEQTYAQALAAGGVSLSAPADRYYGDREATVRDPAGNFWFLATHKTGKSYKPEILQDLNTYFSVKDAGRFLDFLRRAFAAETVQEERGEGGKIAHAKVRIGDTVVELSEGREPWGPRAVAHHYYVENCDDVFARGVTGGCQVLQPMADQVYGDRAGSLLDEWGNHWYIATHREDLTAEEIAQRAAAAASQ